MVDEIRKDAFGRSVVISTARSKRPGAFIDKKEREEACPFCPGKEKRTGKTRLALPNERSWKIRVFENEYPVLHVKNFRPVLKDFFSVFTPCGAHEVLVETRKHENEYFNMRSDDIALSVKALKMRYGKLSEIPDVNYITIFKNKGIRAGASISHPHMQIIAGPLFPDVISKEMDDAENYFKIKKQCGECLEMEKEIQLKKRVVASNSDWVVICPFISKWPYQTTILPRRHFSEILEMEESEIKSLAKIMKRLFSSYYKKFDDPPYNMMYHNFPKSAFWHFHIHIYPRLVTHAGFEFFGLNVNIMTPERAAGELRNAGR